MPAAIDRSAPDVAVALAQVAGLLRERRVPQAREAAGALLRRAPDDAHVRKAGARVAQAAGQHDEAVAHWHRATELVPGDVEAWRGLGAAAVAARLFDVAEQSAERLLAIEGETARGWIDVGHVRWLKRDEGGARAAFARALALDPTELRARWMHAHTPPTLVFADDAAIAAWRAEWRECIAYFAALDASAPGMAARIEDATSLATDFFFHYLGDGFDADHRHAAAVLRKLARIARPDAPAASRAPGAKPRIGFVSRCFYGHSVARVFERLVTALDNRSHELVLFQLGRHRDEVTERFVRHAHVHVAADARPATWRQLILDQRIDVLVYLDVGQEGLVSWLAAQRLAPVQCALWGHPIGTGFDSIDWFLTPDAAERTDAEGDYVEKLVRLPGIGCWFARPAWTGAPRVRAPGAPARFLVAQGVAKITPRHDALYARILEQLPGATLDALATQRPDQREALAARFARAGIAAGRATVHEQKPHEGFVALARDCDVNLDTIGFSGGISSFELLWLDTPTVTLPGRSLRSRQTAGMLSLLELPQLVAQDENDYVRIAVELGRSADLRAELGACIAERKHRLFEDERVPQAFREFIARVAAR